MPDKTEVLTDLLEVVHGVLATNDQVVVHLANTIADPEPVTREMEVMLLTAVQTQLTRMGELTRDMTVLMAEMSDKIIELQK